jgi:hypothetical protein
VPLFAEGADQRRADRRVVLDQEQVDHGRTVSEQVFAGAAPRRTLRRTYPAYMSGSGMLDP